MVRADQDRTGGAANIFENAIRSIGVEFAYSADSDFTKQTIKVLCERSGICT